ncbi:MAG: dTDP-4-dehydrorhamnose 3,5-epimerase [Terracidiphilus sp.]|jgi:dTDP-4-dehydrorhamnose 3,5-epimerase
MQVTETRIPGVSILSSPVYRDGRGCFQVLYQRNAVVKAGIDQDWMQENLSISEKNVVRGLHYQIVQPQSKLVRVVHGSVLDVVLDIRQSSPTFGQHIAVELNPNDGKALFIPAGLAHGFIALEPETVFLYKVDRPYAPQEERTILWNDPELGIEWPISASDAIVSDKDLQGRPFRIAEVFS